MFGLAPPDVRFEPKPDFDQHQCQFRFAPESGHSSARLFGANTGNRGPF
jgi:hypothetical protein